MPISAPAIESIVKGVGGPSQLPGAEIILPALLIKIGKDKEKQQGHKARNDDHTDADTIHDAQNTLVLLMFSRPARQNNSFRHRTDTKESLFAGKKLAIYQEGSAMPLRHCAFHKTATS